MAEDNTGQMPDSYYRELARQLIKEKEESKTVPDIGRGRPLGESAKEIGSVENPLGRHLERRIQEAGPIPWDEYMRAWVHGVVGEDGSFIPGYYSKDPVIGDQDRFYDKEYRKRVDFDTQPEISPLFGFLVSKQIIEMWEKMGKPSDFRVVEMGAGNGTLAHDIVHGLRFYNPEAASAIHYTIVESSSTLIEKQRQRLSKYGVDFVEGSAIESQLGKVTGVVVSNELPDAFPVKMVRRREGQWEELYLGLGNGERFEEIWREPSEETRSFLEEHQPDVEEGRLYPCNLNAVTWMKNVGEILDRGYVMTLDYSFNKKVPIPIHMYMSEEKKTLYQKEQGILGKENVGIGDLTTDVDFQVLVDVGEKEGLATIGYVTEPGFLFGLAYHYEKDNIFKVFSEGQQIGDRTYGQVRVNKLMDFKEPYFYDRRVLIQTKGVDPAVSLSGLEYTHEDHATEKDLSAFKPLKQTKGHPIKSHA